MLKFCRRRPVQAALLAILLFFLFVYLAYGHSIGKMVKEITVSAFESYQAVEPNPFNYAISDENYNHMVQRKYWDFNRPDAYDRYRLSSPFVLHWFTGAKVWISYDYDYYQGDSRKSGSRSAEMRMDLELQNGQWKILNLLEKP